MRSFTRAHLPYNTMLQADFYVISSERFRTEPLRLVCILARKAYFSQNSSVILAMDAAQANALDDLLWAFDPEAFVPHQIIGSDEDEEITPVLIALPEQKAPNRPIAINLRPQLADVYCDRIIEVVPPDPHARQKLRDRWLYYKNQGIRVNSFEM